MHIAEPRVMLYFAKFLRPYILIYAVVLVGMFLRVAASLAYPWFLKSIIDDVIPAKDLTQLFLTLATLVGIMISSLLISFLSGYVFTKANSLCVRDMRMVLFQHIIRAPSTFHDKTESGDMVYRFNSDIAAIRSFLTGTLDLIVDSITLISLIALMCWLNLQLFILCIVSVPLFIVVTILFQTRIKHITELGQTLRSSLMNFLFERFNQSLLIQLHNGFDNESTKLRGNLNELISVNMKSYVYSSGLNTLSSGIMAVTPAIILGVGAYQLMQGTMSLGALMAFLQYFSSMFGPVKTWIGYYTTLIQSSVSMNRIMEFLNVPIKLVPSSNMRAFKLEHRIRFEDIHFSYGEKSVLRGLSLEFERGKKYAIVGASGSGKTTISRLLCGVYTPDLGRIMVDNCDLQEIDPVDLMRRITLVTQDAMMFNDTVWENVRYGDLASTNGDVERLAILLDLSKCVGEDVDVARVKVGERGRLLSGGQKQRIAIARALLKGGDVIVLDEATSALDSDAERLILGNVLEQLSDRTVVWISHRLSTIQSVDEIFCVADGRVVERGRHEKLIAGDGHYRRLFEEQLIK